MLCFSFEHLFVVDVCHVLDQITLTVVENLATQIAYKLLNRYVKLVLHQCLSVFIWLQGENFQTLEHQQYRHTHTDRQTDRQTHRPTVPGLSVVERCLQLFVATLRCTFITENRFTFASAHVTMHSYKKPRNHTNVKLDSHWKCSIYLLTCSVGDSNLYLLQPTGFYGTEVSLWVQPCPSEAEAVCRYCLQIWPQKRSKFEHFTQSTPDSRVFCFTVGAKRLFLWGLSPPKDKPGNAPLLIHCVSKSPHL